MTISTPKTIARIAESGFVWEVFRESRLFPRSSIEDGIIREAPCSTVKLQAWGKIARIATEKEKLKNG